VMSPGHLKTRGESLVQFFDETVPALWCVCARRGDPIPSGWSKVQASCMKGCLSMEWPGGRLQKIGLKGCRCVSNDGGLPGTPAAAGIREEQHEYSFFLELPVSGYVVGPYLPEPRTLNPKHEYSFSPELPVSTYARVEGS
jgi:hypothetical protein